MIRKVRNFCDQILQPVTVLQKVKISTFIVLIFLNSKEPCFDSIIELKTKLSKIVIDAWFTKGNYYSQAKLKLYASRKERPGFEQYLNLSNPKL